VRFFDGMSSSCRVHVVVKKPRLRRKRGASHEFSTVQCARTCCQSYATLAKSQYLIYRHYTAAKAETDLVHQSRSIHGVGCAWNLLILLICFVCFAIILAKPQPSTLGISTILHLPLELLESDDSASSHRLVWHFVCLPLMTLQVREITASIAEGAHSRVLENMACAPANPTSTVGQKLLLHLVMGLPFLYPDVVAGLSHWAQPD